MIELLAGIAAILAVLLIVAIVYAQTYRTELDAVRAERDEARADLNVEYGVTASLENRAKTLRLDNASLEGEVKRLRTENVELQRENGRFASEIRGLKQDAAKRVQPRDPKTGRMLPNPNAKRPRKPRANPAPIACA